MSIYSFAVVFLFAYLKLLFNIEFEYKIFSLENFLKYFFSSTKHL